MKAPRPRRERRRKADLFRRLRIWTGKALLILLACGILFWIGRQIYRIYLVSNVKTVQAKEGALNATFSGEGLILRNETVVKAPRPGYLVRLLPEGSLVRAEQIVATLKPLPDMEKSRGSINLSSPVPGFLCYHPDGWEGVLTPERWSRLNLAGLFDDFKAQVGDGSRVSRAGEPVFKIIDNLSNPYLVVRLEGVGKGYLAPGDPVELEWEGGSGKGRILGTKVVGDCLIMVAEVTRAEPGLPDDRLWNLKVMKPECRGIVIPAEALVRRERTTGVYTNSLLGFRFHRVAVKGRVGDRVAVTGIDPGVEIVINPWVAAKIQKDI